MSHQDAGIDPQLLHDGGADGHQPDGHFRRGADVLLLHFLLPVSFRGDREAEKGDGAPGGVVPFEFRDIEGRAMLSLGAFLGGRYGLHF